LTSEGTCFQSQPIENEDYAHNGAVIRRWMMSELSYYFGSDCVLVEMAVSMMELIVQLFTNGSRKVVLFSEDGRAMSVWRSPLNGILQKFQFQPKNIRIPAHCHSIIVPSFLVS
jgi:hypothetical protein